MMLTTPFWASIALLRALPALAQTIPAPAPTPTSISAAPSCTASLITTLCKYPDPGVDFSIASDGKANCWDYCNAHPPCNFVIFIAGNPYTGTGSCALYPGEKYDASAGSSSGCDNHGLYVYDKPVCSGTPTAGGCAATASPSAVASVCGYPTPADDCFYTCTASEGASDCLSQCAKADSCNYVVFNPHNPDNSPYAPGTCWMYPSGSFDAGAAGTCSGAPEQFVYSNVCPKPSHSSSSASPSASASAAAKSSTASETVGSGTAAVANAALASTTSKTSGSTALRVTNSLAIYMAVLLWRVIA